MPGFVGDGLPALTRQANLTFNLIRLTMSSLNNVQLIGNVGSDPELKTTDTGKKVVSISLATTDKWKDGNGEIHEKTQWHKVTAWGRLAEVCSEFLAKGSSVYFRGSLDYGSYTDKEGIERRAVEIKASEMLLLDKKQS